MTNQTYLGFGILNLRDVTFNKDSIFGGDEEAQQGEPEELQIIITRIEEPKSEFEETPIVTDEHMMILRGFDDDADVYEVEEDSNEDSLPDTERLEATKAWENPAEFKYSAPTSTPPAALFVRAIREVDDSLISNSIKHKI
jgi:hypothetical protein